MGMEHVPATSNLDQILQLPQSHRYKYPCPKLESRALGSSGPQWRFTYTPQAAAGLRLSSRGFRHPNRTVDPKWLDGCVLPVTACQHGQNPAVSAIPSGPIITVTSPPAAQTIWTSTPRRGRGRLSTGIFLINLNGLKDEAVDVARSQYGASTGTISTLGSSLASC
jgi:hypothetical protein